LLPKEEYPESISGINAEINATATKTILLSTFPKNNKTKNKVIARCVLINILFL